MSESPAKRAVHAARALGMGVGFLSLVLAIIVLALPGLGVLVLLAS